MQGLEGDIDTVHAAFLHYTSAGVSNAQPGSAGYYQRIEAAARYSALDTDFGTSYGAYREAEPDTYYWRVAHFLFPFYTMIPGGYSNMGGVVRVNVNIRAWVPLDDMHTRFWRLTKSSQLIETQTANGRLDKLTYKLSNGEYGPAYLPDTTAWLGRGRIAPNASNDYRIDRDSQRRMQSYTGIDGGGAWLEDQAVTESMGPIYDRTLEHLGTSDSMIIRTRRRLIDAAKAMRDDGSLPPCVDAPELYRQRSGSLTLPREVNWWETVTDLGKPFVSRQLEDLPA
jgi:hypothetical protein